MGQRVNVKEAAKTTGLSEYAIRAGIKTGKYPYIKAGYGRGRILIDIDKLIEALDQEAKFNQEEAAERCRKFEEQERKRRFKEVEYIGEILSRKRRAAAH